MKCLLHLAAGLGAAAMAASVSLVFAAELRTADALKAIAIEARPVASFNFADPSRVRFGALEFRGGLVLSSSERVFGGISGLRVEADGAHFLAVTDRGSWLRGRIVYDGNHPSGIADAEMAPLLGPDGKSMAARNWFDAESLENDNGTVYIGLERVEQIVRFDYGHDGLLARAKPFSVPADFKSFKFNRSLECLAMPQTGAPLAGTLIVVTERSLDEHGNLRSYLLDGDRAERFSVKRSDDFDVSDCTILPPADLLLLERRYSPARGVAMRIRRIPLASLKQGALVDGTEIIFADLGNQIDNMEGIAVHKNAAGETIITLVSDDNFSTIQRNLLLQFALVGE
jgi:hypothetical protein